MPAVFCSHLDRPKPETQPLNTLLFEKRSHLFCLELAAKPSTGDELRLCLTTTPHRRRPIPARLGQVYRPLIFGTVDVRTRLHKPSNSSEAQRSGVAVALPKPAQPEAHQQIHGRCRPGSEHREFWGMSCKPSVCQRPIQGRGVLCRLFALGTRRRGIQLQDLLHLVPMPISTIANIFSPALRVGLQICRSQPYT